MNNDDIDKLIKAYKVLILDRICKKDWVGTQVIIARFMDIIAKNYPDFSGDVELTNTDGNFNISWEYNSGTGNIDISGASLKAILG